MLAVIQEVAFHTEDLEVEEMKAENEMLRNYFFSEIRKTRPSPSAPEKPGTINCPYFFHPVVPAEESTLLAHEIA